MLNAVLTVSDAVRVIPGVGRARAEHLERLGVFTVDDLLRLLPHRYEDRRELTPIAALVPGAGASFEARVASAGPAITPRRRLRVFRAVFEDDSGRVAALWFRFRAAHLQSLLRPGVRLLVHGTLAVAGGQREILHPELELLGEDGQRCTPTVRPVYPATEGLPQATLRAIIVRALAAVLPGLEDPLPPALRARLGLPGLAESFATLHDPGAGSPAAVPVPGNSVWHRRLVFDELFKMQLQLALRRRQHQAARPGKVRLDAGKVLKRLGDCLPFALTAAQARVCGEILADMAAPRPMQRLLQGDVGSGKTVVAALAILAAAAGGGQSALLVPTELLAEQHYLTLGGLARALGLEPELLTGGVSRAGRARVLAGLADGRVPLVIGTHALLESRVRFSRLALAVVDEQHRFGVRQRLGLREKGEDPDLLVMTATPIPRSLALTLYGDLDLSTIDELPPGRRAVSTRVVGEAGRRAAWELLRAEVSLGRRAYVVCPLIEEEGGEDPTAAVRAAERLRAQFPQFRVGLLHGRMPIEERSRAMERFRTGEVPLLVATTVVEVGLDVPEATVILIERAERFGLSQLHQLRGRVGRGPLAGHCLLLTGPRPSPEARERLAVLARTADGFAVAEADLEIRGPGHLAGTRQAGLAELRLADLVRDRELLAAARGEARRVVAADPLLEFPEHRPLRALAGDAAGDAAAGRAG
ncbi:MAG: ATP-dependent DNA helicase RecG [Candidatus Methylomirabilia bacterium]